MITIDLANLFSVCCVLMRHLNMNSYTERSLFTTCIFGFNPIFLCIYNWVCMQNSRMQERTEMIQPGDVPGTSRPRKYLLYSALHIIHKYDLGQVVVSEQNDFLAEQAVLMTCIVAVII